VVLFLLLLFLIPVNRSHDKDFYFAILFQRQAERIKRDKAQARRGDDVEPQVQPESLVPVARYHGSRLASGPSPTPFQQSGFSHSSERSTFVRKDYQHEQAAAQLSGHEVKSKQSGASPRLQKAARLSSAATIGAAIVEAENSLEIEVRFPAFGRGFNVILSVSAVL
jgi:5'-3' exoribonuclease 2